VADEGINRYETFASSVLPMTARLIRVLQSDAHDKEGHTLLSDVVIGGDFYTDISTGALYDAKSQSVVIISSVKYVRQQLCDTCKYALGVALASGL
jgi:hypothetical protein